MGCVLYFSTTRPIINNIRKENKKMKKLIAAVLLTLTLTVSVVADDGFAYGFWFNSPKSTKEKTVDGIALGIPVISFKELSGASLALCGNVTEKTTGFEFALIGFNNSTSMSGVQIAFINLQKKQHDDCTVQIGGYNQTGEKGIQVGLINNSRNNALFQLGLININKNGWLPVMILVNFSKEMFD